MRALKRVHKTIKITSVLVVLTLTLSILMVCVNAIEYPASTVWEFQNGTLFAFDKEMNFTDPPKQRIANDSGLIGYWNTNEGTGNIIYDSSGNGINGTLYGPTWINGTYGSALNFNGVNNSIVIANKTSLILNNQFTLSFQYSPTVIPKNESQRQALIGKSYSYPYYEYYIYLQSGGCLRAGVHTNTDTGDVFSNSRAPLVVGGNYSIALTWMYPGQLKIYINGILQGSGTAHNDTIASIGNLVFGNLRISSALYAAGIFDNIRIYNITLSEPEIAALYLEPDPLYSDNFYSYQDSATNNTLLIHFDSSEINIGNSTIVTCTDFFADNRLIFTANNSAVANIWTSLGEPPFTTGVWNSNNYTTTLKLDASSIGELDWNRIPSSASNLSLSSIIVGKPSVFSVLWNDDHGLSGGGYIFSTNNTGQWVNASWVAFSSTPCWGNATLTLTNKAEFVVGFREYANNSLNVWANSCLFTILSANESLPLPTPSPTATSSKNPTTSPTPAAPSSPTATPSSTQNPTSTPTSIPAQNNLISPQAIAIVASAVAGVVVLLAVAFKKGYIVVEVIDEENPQGTQEDYTI